MVRFGVLVLALLCAFSVFTYAQNAEERAAGGEERATALSDGKESIRRDSRGFRFDTVIGAANMSHSSGTNTTYTQLIFSPELEIGIFGIGFDINLEFDAERNLREGEWDSWRAILSKISYFRINEKGDPFYLRAGSLRKASLGHGTIVERFDNTLYMPEVRLMGLQLDMDFDVVGFEIFTSNAFLFDIFAGRAYVRPFSGLLERFYIGTTFAADFDTRDYRIQAGGDKYNFNRVDGDKESVHILGLDVGLPLPSLGILTWLLYADFTTILDAGHGFATGFMGDFAFIFNWKLEFTRSSAHYIPSYFDSLYLINRSTRFEDLENITESYSGWLFRIWQDFSIIGKNDLTVSLQIRDSFNDTQKPMMSFDLYVDRQLIFDRVEFNLNYTKSEIDSFGSAFKIRGLDTFITMSVGYMIAENVMISIIYQKTFIDDPAEPGTLKGQETTMVQTQLKF
jgi:hypothetical protein